MTPENLAYWLQGYFELGVSPINDFCLIIDRHIDLVFLTMAENKTPPKASEKAFLLAIREAAREKEINEIKVLVSKQFEHVIDPAQYAGDSLSSEAHHGVSSHGLKFNC